jgi:biotin carboxyl carrier protein
MIEVKVNDIHTFSIEQQSDKFLVNGVLHAAQIHNSDGKNFKVIFNNRCYLANVTLENDQLRIKINQNTYLLEIKDENELMLEKLGLESRVTKRTDEIKAPMPGMIVDVLVSKGDVVKSGQPLLVLKAMKMENIIKSPHDGVVHEIFIKKDQIIEKDAVMLQF